MRTIQSLQYWSIIIQKIIGVIIEITFMDEGVKINCETKKEHKGSPYVITCLLI